MREPARRSKSIERELTQEFREADDLRKLESANRKLGEYISPLGRIDRLAVLLNINHVIHPNSFSDWHEGTESLLELYLRDTLLGSIHCTQHLVVDGDTNRGLKLVEHSRRVLNELILGVGKACKIIEELNADERYERSIRASQYARETEIAEEARKQANRSIMQALMGARFSADEDETSGSSESISVPDADAILLPEDADDVQVDEHGVG